MTTAANNTDDLPDADSLTDVDARAPHVIDSIWEGWIQGMYFRNLAVFERDDGGCDTIRGGDSGGAIYQGMSSRPGYMRAMGIVTATDNCTSYYTKLSGVRAWDSSITMPTL